MIAMQQMFEKIAEWLGVGVTQAKGIVFGFLFLLIIGIGLASTAGVDLVEDYGTVTDGGAPDVEEITNPLDERREHLRKRVKLPTLLSDGQVIPDSPPRPNGVVLRCGPALRGQAGLTRGWVWTDKERGCRRVAKQP